MTTPELVRRLAKACGVNERDIGYAGMKDKHAVTTHKGKKGAALHSSSKTKAKGKLAAAGKSHRLNRGKHNTTKSAVASAHRGKRHTRTHSPRTPMTPPASASPSH